MLPALLLPLLLSCAARRAPEPEEPPDPYEVYRKLAEEEARKTPEQRYQQVLALAAHALDPHLRAEARLRAAQICDETARKLELWALEDGRTDPNIALWWGRSAEGYQRFIEEYPDHPRIDEALYGLGEALLSLDRDDEALAAWNRLLSEHPQSRWAGRAWREIADYRFARSEFALAREAYLRADLSPDISGDARYKLAQSCLQLQDQECALAELRMLAALKTPADHLRRQALQDLPPLYIAAGRAAHAQANLELLAADPAEAAWLLGLLAAALESSGLPAEAAHVRARLAQIAPPPPAPP